MNDIYKGDLEARSRAVQRIVCAFRFDPKITENTLRLNSESVDADVLAQWLSTTRIIWIHRDEYGKSKSLFEQLSRLSSKEQPPSVVARDIPQLWEGNYTYKDSLRSIPMVLHIERMDNSHIFGRNVLLNFPMPQNRTPNNGLQPTASRQDRGVFSAWIPL